MDTLKEITEKLSPLESLIGTDNLQDAQRRIADLIVNRVASDIDAYDCFMFYPGDYHDSIDDAFESVQKKITKMYKDAMLEVAEKAVEKFKDDAVNFANNMSEKSD